MPVTLTKTTSALTLAQKSAQASTFITAGSCSVMLSWPMRRLRRCQGNVEFSGEACAGGSGVTSACVSGATISPVATALIPNRDATGKMLTPAFNRSRRFMRISHTDFDCFAATARHGTPRSNRSNQPEIGRKHPFLRQIIAVVQPYAGAHNPSTMRVADAPMKKIDDWDDFVGTRYREGKTEEEFRDYKAD